MVSHMLPSNFQTKQTKTNTAAVDLCFLEFRNPSFFLVLLKMEGFLSCKFARDSLLKYC